MGIDIEKEILTNVQLRDGKIGCQQTGFALRFKVIRWPAPHAQYWMFYWVCAILSFLRLGILVEVTPGDPGMVRESSK